MSLKVCRIKNPRTGLYSRGGSYRDRLWGKRGKAWSDLAHMKCHLREFGKECVYRHYRDADRYAEPKATWPYRGCVVEIADFEAGTTTAMPMKDLLATMKDAVHGSQKRGRSLLEALVERYGEDEV